MTQLELGKHSAYENQYNPNKLFPIARAEKRIELGIDPKHLPFYGEDSWNHYEVSWLNPKGKPMVAIANIRYNCDSEFIIESKSMKLYFNSFNQSIFEDKESLEHIISQDISLAIQSPVQVEIMTLEDVRFQHSQTFSGLCLDDLDVDCQDYLVNPSLLKTQNIMVTETVYSNLLKSNCLVTLQPDWGSIQITYTGPKIDHASLLQYLVSFRNHNEFHEQCIERIFMDLQNYCCTQHLIVYGKYTRRGGVDINPIRSSQPEYSHQDLTRLVRQ